MGAAVLHLRGVGGGAREPRAFDVQLVGDPLHAVVGLRDARRGEGVGRDDVGAGAVIGEMDVAHRLRPGEVEQIVVAAHFAVPGIEARAAVAVLVEPERLDHGAHGAVEHQDALRRDAPQHLPGRGEGKLGLEFVHVSDHSPVAADTECPVLASPPPRIRGLPRMRNMLRKSGRPDLRWGTDREGVD